MGVGNNVIYELSKKFAIRIVRLYVFLTEEKHEYVIALQIYRSEQVEQTSLRVNLHRAIMTTSTN